MNRKFAFFAQTPGTTSYLASSYVKPVQLVAVKIDNIESSEANVKNEKYPFWSYEHMYTNGQPTNEVANFITFVTNDEQALQKLGFISVQASALK